MTVTVPQFPRGSNRPASQLWPSLTISHPLIGTHERASGRNPLWGTPCQIGSICVTQPVGSSISW